MMKLKTAAILCIAVSGMAGLALAQDGSTSSAFPTPSTSSSAVSAPRTGLYTGVTKGNAAADNTVDDYSRRPTLIGDKQYFAGYGSADMQSGAFSFEGNGLNWFGAATGGTNPNLIRFGVGSGTSWGGGVLLALDHISLKNDAVETDTTYQGDGYGLFGDYNLGSSDVYGQIGWFTGFPNDVGESPTGNTSTVKPSGGTEVSIHNWNITLLAGWKKDATTEATHSLNAEFTYTLGNGSSDGLPVEIDDSFNRILLGFYHGYILKATSGYSVFLGSNTDFVWEAAKSKNAPPAVDDEAGHIGLAVSPNIAFQKQFSHGFEGFSGASITGSFDSYSFDPGSVETGEILTRSADVAIGLRWVKDNFALEGSMKETLIQNGPYIIGGNTNQGMFYTIGMSLGI